MKNFILQLKVDYAIFSVYAIVSFSKPPHLAWILNQKMGAYFKLDSEYSEIQQRCIYRDIWQNIPLHLVENLTKSAQYWLPNYKNIPYFLIFQMHENSILAENQLIQKTSKSLQHLDLLQLISPIDLKTIKNKYILDELMV
jgi:hypothetical protein